MPDKICSIGIIGGTGFYGMELDEPQSLHEDTPFGAFEAMTGFVAGKKVVFIARHGREHDLLPHEVNYRANIYALKKLGVRRVFAFCMAGTLRGRSPGDIVIPDQFIDFAGPRMNTFYGNRSSVYISMAEPFCPELSSFAEKELSAAGFRVHSGGTYICIQGPHFSTKAESRFYSNFGDIIGMTAATEAKLAREAGLCYCVIASIVDYNTCSMGMKDMRKVLQNAKMAARKLAGVEALAASCTCANSLSGSVVNRPGISDSVLMGEEVRNMFHSKNWKLR